MRAIEFTIPQNYYGRIPLMEMPLPADWDKEELSSKSTFQKRLDYALERSKKVGMGSSRVAMIIPFEGRDTILKIAKNGKGLGQNKAEVDVLSDGYYGKLDIVIPLIDYDKDNDTPIWLQTELAQHVTEEVLGNKLGCNDAYELVQCAKYIIGENKWDERRSPKYMKEKLEQDGKSPEDIDRFLTYAGEIASLASADIILGDFSQAENWGLYKGNPVVIDLGFTRTVATRDYGFKL